VSEKAWLNQFQLCDYVYAWHDHFEKVCEDMTFDDESQNLLSDLEKCDL